MRSHPSKLSSVLGFGDHLGSFSPSFPILCSFLAWYEIIRPPGRLTFEFQCLSHLDSSRSPGSMGRLASFLILCLGHDSTTRVAGGSSFDTYREMNLRSTYRSPSRPGTRGGTESMENTKQQYSGKSRTAWSFGRPVDYYLPKYFNICMLRWYVVWVQWYCLVLPGTVIIDKASVRVEMNGEYCTASPAHFLNRQAIGIR